ncbi:MAG: hypothetical protein ACK56I_33890, partial [bacterium]
SILSRRCSHYKVTAHDKLKVWRLITAPLATDSFIEILIIMNFYYVKVAYPIEFYKGTAAAIAHYLVLCKPIEVSTIGSYFTLSFTLVAFVIGPRGGYICGTIPLNIIIICQ